MSNCLVLVAKKMIHPGKKKRLDSKKEEPAKKKQQKDSTKLATNF